MTELRELIVEIKRHGGPEYAERLVKEILRLEGVVARLTSELEVEREQHTAKITAGTDLSHEVAALRAAGKEAVERIAQLKAALVKCAIPYEALLADKASRKWIAPRVWAAMEAAVLEARALVPPGESPP